MGAISHLEFIVEPDETHWKVRLRESDRCCLFPSRLAALRAAIRDAERVREMGHEVRVSARRRDGTLRLVQAPEPEARKNG